MRLRTAIPVLLFLAVMAGCKDTLTVNPVNQIPAERALNDVGTARAALAGAYDALQDDSTDYYYAGDVVIFGDLPSDDVQHSGTFGSYLEADLNQTLSSNNEIEGMWRNIYRAIARVNVIISKLPDVAGISAADRDDILGQAYFIRALSYFNLVSRWGGVPLRLTPPASVVEASQIARSTEAEVYAQIESDLDQALALIKNVSDTRQATPGAALALRSRVELYQQKWQAVIDAANATAAVGYSLAPRFSDLFDAEGADTPEDIFRLGYTAVEPNVIGYYYLAKGFGGRFEVAPTCELVNAFDPDVNCAAANPMATWSPTDARASWSIAINAGEAFGTKFPTGIGAEDLHVIRFAEVILNRAEAEAQLGQLSAAVTDYNRTRVRAGLTAHVLGVTDIDPGPGVNLLDTQAEVLDEIYKERRLELAFEGFRWPDLVRTGRAVAVVGLSDRPYQVLFPIPQAELDVAPNVEQNAGY